LFIVAIRGLLKKISLPQLIIIDGGKGQLSAALKSIDELGLRGKIAVMVLQKTGGYFILEIRFRYI
jgi:excinuclease UvrABC nuclease subunit